MLKINELARIYLGVKQENESRTIEIDMSAWASIYPNATADILHKRSGDQTKYLTGATYDSDTMILSWTPTEYDTFYEGFGIAEIRMVEGDVVKKTKDLLVTAVSPSLIDGTGEVIASDYQAWLDTVLGYKQAAAAAQEAAEDAQAAAEDAQDAAEDAQDAAEAAITKWPKIDEDNGNWLVWDAEQGEYVDTGVHAQGPQGEPGTIENVRATGIKMSMLDDTSVYDAIYARADKVAGATGGNFAGLDSSGNLTDSGHKHSDYITSHQDISGKADKVSSATSGNFAGLDENGNLTDSGHKHSDYLTSHQDISGKADKVSSPTAGDLAALDENGNLTDSGSKAADFAAAANLYGNKIPMSSSDSTKISSNISANQESIQDLRKGMVLVAKLTSGNWQLNSGVNAAIGDYISVNGVVGRATAAIIGGTTNIVENTNWVKLTEGAVNELVDNIGTISTNLGDPTSASGVTGADAFSKISTLNSNIDGLLSSASKAAAADFNNCKTAGTYKGSNGLTSNLPTSGYFVMTVIQYSSNDLAQIAEEINDGRMFKRVFHDGTTWTSWEELALNSKIATDWNNISSWCSSAESEATTHMQKFGAMRAITFRGVSRSHTEDEVLMTIPEGNRPLTNMYSVATIGAIPVVIQIRSDNGNVVLFLVNNAGTGRIHFSIAYVANIT